MSLKNKHILIGVSGSIAAYKIANLTRLFIKEGAEVRIIMTEDAKEFITPLTLSTLSKNPVFSSFYKNKEEGTWVNHVELGLWADCMLIAPATANTIAKLTTGIADNLLVATYLSARCPVFVAPAMDLDMYAHPTTKRNIDLLKQDNIRLIDVEDGELASGLSGRGRLAEPEHIVAQLQLFFSKKKQNFSNKTVLVSAGPTREDIDPVRFISNHSSGTMGVEIANAFAEHGANVHLVLGPTTKTFHFNRNIHLHHVVSAADMLEKVQEIFPQTDITVMSAAVADYTPKLVFDKKVKKNDGDLNIELERTVDILKKLGETKQDHQTLVGFALETNNEVENAIKKLHRKNLDFIVLNSLRDKGAGFKHNTNKITIIDKHEKLRKFDLKTKAEVAQDILSVLKQTIDE